MKGSRPRVVVDCNVLLQALLNKGPAFRCLECAESDQIELLMSAEVLREARDVFVRPALISRYPQLEPKRVSAFLELLARISTLLEVVPHAVSFPRDPKDEPCLDLAAAGRAEYLISRDKDVLSLPQAIA